MVKFTYRSRGYAWLLQIAVVWLSGSSSVSSLRAEIKVSDWKPAYVGVDLADGSADANEPRLQRVFVARVRLNSPGIEFLSTPRTGKRETLGETAGEFLRRHHLQLAVNANFYDPVKPDPVDIDLEGLAISNGSVVSPPSPGLPALCLSKENHATFVENTPSDFKTTGIYTAVAGSRMILRHGKFTGKTDPNDIHPRTAAGLSEDGRTMYLLVIDGRQPGYSVGANDAETAQWLLRFGAVNGLMLDGGGSTTLVRANAQNNPQVLNQPIHQNIRGRQRLNGNHLGLRARPLEKSNDR